MERAVAVLLATLAFSDNSTLHGTFLYDDAGTVVNNPLMKNSTSHWLIWTHDYWGEELTHPNSHKSWRPVTTYSLRWNYEQHGLDTFGYHVVNVACHAVVSGLVASVARVLFHNDIAALIAGSLYAVHPVHVEAVANISGRAELMSAMFYLTGFLCYTHPFRNRQHSPSSTHISTAAMFIFTILSLLSKEPGITLPIVCAVWDILLGARLSLPALVMGVGVHSDNDRQRLKLLCHRLAWLVCGTAFLVFVRFEWTGASNPVFIYDQNPAAFHKDPLTRFLSKSLVYTLYVKLLVWPTNLCCDWSGESIPLMHSIDDPRFPVVAGFYVCLALGLLVSGVLQPRASSRQRELTTAFSFLVVPFLLSANIFIVVGLMKAERVMYLPSVGYCLLVGRLISLALPSRTPPHAPPSPDQPTTSTSPPTTRSMWSGWRTALLCVVGAWLAVTARQCMQYNAKWQNGWELWSNAYNVNPRSAHIWHNFGLELSWKEYDEAAALVFENAVLRKPEDLNTWFALAIALRRIGRCDRTIMFMKQGLLMSELQREVSPSRDGLTSITRRSKSRERAHMLAAMALCETYAPYVVRMLQEALVLDPTNSFAKQQLNDIMALAAKQGIV